MKGLLIKWYWLIIVLTVIITLFFGWQLKNVKINNDVRIFLPEDHSSNRAFDEVESIFGGTDRIIIGVESIYGTVYNNDVFATIDNISNMIENVEGVHSVMSITQIDFVDSDQYGISVSKLSESDSDNYDYELIQNRINSWEIYKDNIVSEDGTLSGIVVNLKSGLDIKQKQDIYKAIEQTLNNHPSSACNIYMTGEPAIIVLMGRRMINDISTLIPFVIAVLIIVLLISFRNFGGVVYPLITVIISSIWSIGLMSMLGISLSLVATVIPVLLIAVGSAYGIHLVTHYYDSINKAGNITKEMNADIVIGCIKDIFKPLTLSALTTIAGFGSLVTSSIVPIKTFGLFTALGVLFSFIITIILIPAILINRDKFLNIVPKIRMDFIPGGNGIINSIIAGILQIIRKHKKWVILVCIIVLGGSVFFSTKIIAESSIVEYFRPSTDLRRSDKILNQKLGGTFVIDVVISGNESGSIKDVELLDAMDKMASLIRTKYSEKVGKVISFAEFVKRLNQVMHYDEPDNGAAFYEIPIDINKYGLTDPADLNNLVSEYLLFYDGDLSTVVDDVFEPTQTRMIIQVKSLDSTTMRNIKHDLEQIFADNFDTTRYKMVVSGWADIQLAVNDLIVKGQISNIFVSIIAVILIIGITFRSIKIGLLGIIPLSIAVFTNFGIMGLLGIKLDIGTSMISAIAIGTGIDYSIHIISAYYKALKENVNPSLISEKVIGTTGKAIIYNAVSVSAGFAVLLFSNFIPLVYLGLLISVTMFTTSFAALIILPILFEKFFISKGGVK